MPVTELFANDPITTVTAGGTSAPAAGTTETWTVASAASFPVASTGISQFHVSDPALPTEKILVTNTAGTTWTVTRGAEGTAPLAHVTGFTVRQVVTAGFLAGIPLTLVPTLVQTANYTDSPGDLALMDVTSGPLTVTLPNAPADRTIAGAMIVRGGSGANAVTVACQGADQFNDDGSVTAALNLQNQAGTWQYSATAARWYAVSNDLPLFQLDGRYAANPMTTLGDLLYGGTGGAASRLAGNTTAIRQFLASQGTGTAALAPSLGPLQISDIPALPYLAAMVPTVQNVAAYTASPGDFVLADTSGGLSPVITLPSAPADKSLVGVKIYKQPNTNTVTVQRSGSDTFDDTANTSRTLALLLQGSVYQYDAALGSWITIMGFLGLSQLDSRYVASVTAADSSVVIGGTASAPTVASVAAQQVQRVLCT